jgi:hypothetical protein
MQELEPILDSLMDEIVCTELGMPNPPEPLPIKQEMPGDDLEPIDMEWRSKLGTYDLSVTTFSNFCRKQLNFQTNIYLLSYF